MDRIYAILEEVQNGTKSPKILFDKVGHIFKNNLVEYQIFINELEAESYFKFLGGNESPIYGDIILTDKGRGYLVDHKPHFAKVIFEGPCDSWGKMKCKEHFVTEIDDLCNTCFLRTKIESVRANMIMKFKTVKDINNKEYVIEHLKNEIKEDNKKIADMLNYESTGGDIYRENRVGLYLSYKDCVKYYTEQLAEIIAGSTDTPIPDTEFIQGKRTESFTTEVIPETGTVTHYFEITKNGEKRKYTPYKYLDLILECHFIAIDKEPDINLKISGIVNAKVIINRQIRTHGLNRHNYDFTNIFAEIEDTMFQLKSYKELGISNAKPKLKGEFQNSKQESETATIDSFTLDTIQNNFDNVAVIDIYNHFYNALVKTRHLSDSELLGYLKCAFDEMKPPDTLFKLTNSPTKNKVMKVFYDYYTNVASKPYRQQKKYAALLGEYFEGYTTITVSTNFNK